jgi:hypothetical protein
MAHDAATEWVRRSGRAERASRRGHHGTGWDMDKSPGVRSARSTREGLSGRNGCPHSIITVNT